MDMSTVIDFPFTPKGQLLRLYHSLISPIQKRYYVGIALQTDFDYMHSERFRLRYEALGLDFAKEAFFENRKEREYFFNLTRENAPLTIRLAHLCDAILGRTPRPYTFG